MLVFNSQDADLFLAALVQIDVGGLNENARDRNRLCIEDPFETPYNVARTVTKDGLYTIRGEFMRATRILTQHRDQRDRAVLALAELCMEREDELARAPRSSSPAPRSLGGGSRSGGFGMTGWKHMSGGAPSPYDRMSSPSSAAPGGMMSPSTTGPPEADDYGRRSFSHAGTKRGRQPQPQQPTEVDNRHYSAQERWLAQAGLGLDGHMGAGAAAGGNMFGQRAMGGMPDMRGRGDAPAEYGVPPARRMSAMTSHGMSNDNNLQGGLGSASAPISPVKQGVPLPDPRASNGTWSASVSPRQAASHRLPPVMDPRVPGGGLPGRRVSGNAGRGGAGLPTGNGFDARPPQVGASANGYGRYASPPSAAPTFHNNAINNTGARRAFSVGPAQALNYGGAQSSVPAPDSGFVYNGNNSHQAPNNGTSPLPAFLPFGAGPSQFKNGGNHLYGMSPPSFISPTALLSPESRSTPLDAYPNMYSSSAGHVGAIGTRQVAAHDSGRGTDDGNEALDALASGLKQVALGLDAGEQAQPTTASGQSYNNVPVSSASSGTTTEISRNPSA
ncbi:hypothetical protein QFC22_005362 [Naganishia vaughanmartiniae]|uniref:Uncharacterized protein n=1 Tax=Naganishia vaughanmartiniae TaxID=1424756 RepID=A0ACC2WV60_9TREE|nr:hypothetical protein QFC22_005362 [Naganishia vaughanmartiniae]